jgi:hypothetical protein
MSEIRGNRIGLLQSLEAIIAPSEKGIVPGIVNIAGFFTLRGGDRHHILSREIVFRENEEIICLIGTGGRGTQGKN